jgi:DNA repair protein RadC
MELNMRLHKIKAGEAAGTYLIESPVTEADILLMAKQLASQRLRRGRQLTAPQDVFNHLQTLLEAYEYEVFALLMLDCKHRVIAFHELFRGTLDGASVYPREVVKIALEHNAAAMILVHNHPSGDPEPSLADRTLTKKLQEALNLVGVRTIDHVIVAHEGCVSLAEQGHL